MTGTKVEAVHHHGVGAVEKFLVGRVLEAEPHPDADRLQVCLVDLGEAGAVAGSDSALSSVVAPEQRAARIVCGAANVAAGQTVAVARPGALMPDGRRLEAVKLRGVLSEGMILAASELELGTRRRRDPRARRLRARCRVCSRDPAGRGAADRDRGARARGNTQPPRLPRHVRGRPRAARRDRGAAVAGAVARGSGVRRAARRARRSRSSARSCAGASPRACSRTSRIAQSPPWLQARLTGGRPAADQQRRRHHQLRDAPHRSAAARLRPRPRRGRAADGASRARGRAGADARRAGAHARPRDGPDRGRRGPDIDRRADGRCALGGAVGHEPRAARGRHLERTQHPPHLARSGPAQRGVVSLREGPAARAVRARAGRRHAPDGRAVRRHGAAGDDRRGLDPRAGGRDRPALLARARDPGRARRARAPGRDPRGARLRHSSVPTTACEVDRAGPAARRCHARDRSDRGGRPHRRPRSNPRDPAGPPRSRGHAQPRPAGAQDGRGRDGGQRPVRDRRLELQRPGIARPAAPRSRSSSARGGADRESPLGDAVDHAPDAARLAARRGAPQRLAQRPGHRDLRVRARCIAPRATARRPTSTTRWAFS